MSVNSTETSQRTTRLHDLDLQYQKNHHKTDLISRDEDARRLQLRVLLLRDENAQLQDKCAAKDGEIKALSQNSDKLRVELDEIKMQNRSKDAQIKGLAIEVTSSATGIESCATTVQDLSRALEENIALTKELGQLRPEIELLRQQVVNYEEMISKQHGLQHQQNHLEIALTSKKYSKPESPNDESEGIIELRSRLDETTEKMAQGERQRERMKLDHQKELDESQRQKQNLEGQVSTLEKKLKDSQTQLRNIQQGLQGSRSSLKNKSEDGSTSNQELTARTHNKGQSPAAGKERLPHKKAARKRATEQAIMGEKSTFSITPFLNRTKDYTLDTAGETTGLGLTLDEVLAQVESDNPSPLGIANKSDTQFTVAPDVEWTASTPLNPREKLRLKSPEARSKSKSKGGTMAEFLTSKLAVPNQDIGNETIEDRKDGEISKPLHSKETVPLKRIKTHDTTIADRGSEFEHKKRKRKLLSKTNTNTIIEEDETGEGAQPMETQPGRTRKLKSSLGNTFNSQSTDNTFSPLKRHRRGVNASFLA
ncbi:hypothetical protein V8C37DRAFT_411741 [Trichoderma ceciliae]